MKTLIAMFMTVLALGLVACGDDDDDSPSQGTNAQTNTTATTEDNGKSKTSADSRKKRRSSRSDDSERSRSSKRKSRKPPTTNSGKGLTPPTVNPNSNKNAGKEPTHTEQEAEDLSSQLIAKRVCQGFLPKQTEREIEKNKTTFQEIARNYAKGWPAAKRDEAYKGCLQGLRARKVDK